IASIYARHVGHEEEYREEDQGRPHVGLGDYYHDGHQDDREGDEEAPEGGLVLGFGQVLGEEEDDRDLHELGRLDAEFPEEPYPGLRAVDLMPEEADVEDEEEEEG